jgi:hypothetical protein
MEHGSSATNSTGNMWNGARYLGSSYAKKRGTCTPLMCTVYCTEYALLLGTEDIRSTVLVLLPRLDRAQW